MNFIKKLGNLSKRLKWVMFDNKRDCKIDSRIVNYLSQSEDEDLGIDSTRLENLVKETLISEFGADIKDSKSYGLLVDAVVHNLKKKQLESFDKEEKELEI